MSLTKSSSFDQIILNKEEEEEEEEEDEEKSIIKEEEKEEELSSSALKKKQKNARIEREIDLRISTVENPTEMGYFKMVLKEKTFNADKTCCGVMRRAYYYVLFRIKFVKLFAMFLLPACMFGITSISCIQNNIIEAIIKKQAVESNDTLYLDLNLHPQIHVCFNRTIFPDIQMNFDACNLKGFLCAIITVSIEMIFSYIFTWQSRYIDPLTKRWIVDDYSPWQGASFIMAVTIFGIAAYSLVMISSLRF